MTRHARSKRTNLRTEEPSRPRYVLRLFVTGMTPRSSEAIHTLRAICAEYLQGRYELDVVDIYQKPELVRDEQILAAPTLVRKLPLPLRKLIGNLSDRERVLKALELISNTP